MNLNLKARVARAAPHGPLPPTRATLPGAIFLEAARPLVDHVVSGSLEFGEDGEPGDD